MVKYYAVRHKDRNILKKSRSGGFFGPLEKVCGYRSTIKILFCPFIKLNNG